MHVHVVCGKGRQSSLIELNSHTLQSERDVSVRQRAIDLLYAMCDHTNAQTIVEELLHYLEKADYSIRETLVR